MNRILAALLLFLVTSACGGGDSSPTPAAPSASAVPVRVIRLRIAGNTALTAVGQTAQLATVAMMSDGTERDVTAATTWSSSDPLVITVSAAGLATAQRFGIASVTARHENVIATTSLTASPPGTFVFGGRVREPGQGGIAGVTVTDLATLNSVQTNAEGNYVLVAVQQPQARLRLHKDGYETAEITTTQQLADTPLQPIMRLRAGDKVSYAGFAPNDFTYVVDGVTCSPCRLVRVVADAPATFQFRVTWNEPRVILSLWAQGSVTAGSTAELEADVPVPRGESVVYLGLKHVTAFGGFHVPFTIEASLR
jgi:hypothetical protein